MLALRDELARSATTSVSADGRGRFSRPQGDELASPEARPLVLGLVRPGLTVDSLVCDAATVFDLATQEEPEKAPPRLLDVIVNGVFALRAGRYTGARPGKVAPCLMKARSTGEWGSRTRIPIHPAKG